MRRPYLNVDAGELPDEAEELYRLADLVNVACGGHAGDDASMRRVLSACAAFGTRAGAHPSYPDREGFGRRALAAAPDAMRASVEAQCARLASIARPLGVRVASMKPHGALYHAANADDALADAVVTGAKAALGVAMIVVGPANGALARAASRAGVDYAREAFADRGVRPDGTLVPRGEPGALVTDPMLAATRARELAARDDVDTICVHGDTANALAIARAVREVLGA